MGWSWIRSFPGVKTSNPWILAWAKRHKVPAGSVGGLALAVGVGSALTGAFLAFFAHFPLVFVLFTSAFGMVLTLGAFHLLGWREEQEVKAQLPFFLRELAELLAGGVALDRAIVLTGRHYIFFNLIKELGERAKKGESWPALLSQEAERWADESIRALWIELAMIFRQGVSVEALRELALSLRAGTELQMRSSSGLAVVLALMFIFVSVFLPLFFAVIYEVDKALLHLGLSMVFAKLAFAFFFPGLTFFVLEVLKHSTPPYFPRLRFPSFSFFVLPALLGVFAVFFSLPTLTVLFISSLLFLAFRAGAFFRFVERENIEKELRSLLIGACGFPSVRGTKGLMELLGERAKGPLKTLLSNAVKRIKRGEPTRKVLSSLAREGGLVGRFGQVLLACETLGLPFTRTLVYLAEDALLIERMLKERAAALSLNKLTILGSVFLLPLAIALSHQLALSIRDVFPGIRPLSPLIPALHVFFFSFAVFSSELLGELDASFTARFFYLVLLLFLAFAGWQAGMMLS